MSRLSSRELAIERILQAIAYSSIAILFIITFFIFKEGLPFIFREGLGDILGGVEWRPTKGQFGILPMVVGSPSW